MSTSFCYQVVNPTALKSFAHGTSSDADALRNTFGNLVSSKQIHILRAMHAATQQKASLWSDIADKLEYLQGDDFDKEVQLKVWVEY